MIANVHLLSKQMKTVHIKNVFVEYLQIPMVSAAGFWMGSVLILSTVQWICIQFIATHCAPWTFFGPFFNVFSLGSPVCHAVNKFQLDISNQFISTWSLAVPVAVAVLVNKK